MPFDLTITNALKVALRLDRVFANEGCKAVIKWWPCIDGFVRQIILFRTYDGFWIRGYRLNYTERRGQLRGKSSDGKDSYSSRLSGCVDRWHWMV